MRFLFELYQQLLFFVSIIQNFGNFSYEFQDDENFSEIYSIVNL